MAAEKISRNTLDLVRDIVQVFNPPPDITVSEWADQNRVLTSTTSAESGPWRTSRVPYMREVMDCLSPNSVVQEITFMKAAQVAGSESINNWIGCSIDINPGPMMLVQPTVELAKKYSKQRIATMIAATPSLRAKVKDSRSRDSGNTTLTKDFPGGILAITGANSAAGLRSMPAEKVALDEVDAYVEDVEGEGDPVDIITARTRTFANRKVIKVSTPTIKDKSRIEMAYLETDQRRFFVPCPQCGHMHILEWCNFIIPENEKGKKLWKQAHMVCPECGGIIEEKHKTEMFLGGEWRVTCPENVDLKRRGYHISALYSPIGFYSWAEIAEYWLKAQKDTSRQKTFTNTILGETWEEKGAQLEYEDIMKRRHYYHSQLPDNVLVLTASVDVQDDRLETEVVGWGLGKENWGIQYKVFAGDPGVLKSRDPSKPSVWEQLDTYLWSNFSYGDDNALSISCTCIDSGGHFTTEVYEFCKPREHRKIFAIKGIPGAGKPIVGKPSKNNRKKCILFPLGVDTGKDLIMSRLKVLFEGPGYCHFPMESECGYDEDYFKGLTAEKKVTKWKNGRSRTEWTKKSGARNEPLDLRNYATAALEILNPNLEALAMIPHEKKKEIAAVKASPKKRRVLSSGVSV